MADHTIQIDVIAKTLQETVSLLKQLREDVKAMNHTTVNIDVKANVKGVTQSINNLRRELAEFSALGAEMNTANIEFFDQKIQEIIDRMDQANNMKVDPEVNSEGLEKAASAAERLAAGLDIAASISSSLSSVFSGLGDFGGLFADSFGAMSGMFDFDAAGTAKRYLTAMATRAVTGQISGIIQRYDIMNTFSDYMELAGVSQADAEQYLSRVDQSIRGIPIGLDEAAFRLRKYQMYLGDPELATQFTIGIQKAITAGGASEQMKTTAYTQIDRLLATGKLGQSRQWLSLFNGLGVSLKFLREELALDPTADLKTIAADLANGTIATEDFIAAIARMADNEGLDRAIEIYKGTIEAWMSNIQNAIKRGGQNVMESVNDVMEDTLGFGITGVMKQVRDGIDTVSKDAGNYIRENPQNVQTISDAVGGLIERVTSLDGGRFVDNLVTNISGLADGIGRIFDSMPPGFLEDFVSFATTWAGPMATVMKAAQSGLGVVLGVFDRMDDMDMADLMEKITDQIWNMADAVSSILGLIPDGLLGDLMAFGLVWGKPLASVLESISGALKNLAGGLTAEGFANANGLMGQLGWLVTNHPVLLGIAGVIGAIAIGVGQMAEAEKKYAEVAQEQLGIDEIERKLQKYSTLGEQLESAYEQFDQNLGLIRGTKEEASQVLNEAFDLYDKLLTTEDKHERHTILEDLANDIARLQTLAPGIDLSQLLKGDIDAGAAAEMRDLAQAYIDFVSAQAEADAMQSMLTDVYTTKKQAELARDDLEKERRNLLQEESEARRDMERMTRYANEHGNPTTVNEDGFERTIYDRDYNSQLRQVEARASAAADEVGRVEDGIKNTNETIDETDKTINKLTPDLANLEQQVDSLEGKDYSIVTGEDTKILTEYEKELQKLTDGYNEYKEAVYGSLEGQFQGFEPIEPIAPAAIADMYGGLESQNAAMEQYGTALETIRNSLAGLSDEEIANLAPGISMVLEGEFDNAQYVLGLADAISSSAEEAQRYIDAAAEQAAKLDGVASVIADIQTVLSGGSEAEEATREHPELFPGLQEALEGFQGLEELDLSGFLENVSNMSQDAGEAFSTIEESASNAASQIDAVRTSIDQAASTASGRAGAMGMLGGSLDALASSAANAFSNVSALAVAIARLQDKTVTIRINVLGSLGRAAKGGMAGYFASGGNVLDFPGMGSGTDIVPAWLTPGEYVMRRSAVGLFGSRFMDRVNKMDIGGAFDALMARISNPMMHGNTYNRDNHAQVINNFYGNSGQDYSQRKAYRYVGSL